jgi:hypothetical protein
MNAMYLKNRYSSFFGIAVIVASTLLPRSSEARGLRISHNLNDTPRGIVAWGANSEQLDPLLENKDNLPQVGRDLFPSDLIQAIESDQELKELARAPASFEKENRSNFEERKKSKKTSKRYERMPASISEGLELRVHYESQISVFWVLKRQNRYELSFANNGGSRASLNLPKEAFYEYTSSARRLQKKGARLQTSKCKNQKIELRLISGGFKQKPFGSCLNEKGPVGDTLRYMGNSLSLFLK